MRVPSRLPPCCCPLLSAPVQKRLQGTPKGLFLQTFKQKRWKTNPYISKARNCPMLPALKWSKAKPKEIFYKFDLHSWLSCPTTDFSFISTPLPGYQFTCRAEWTLAQGQPQEHPLPPGVSWKGAKNLPTAPGKSLPALFLESLPHTAVIYIIFISPMTFLPWSYLCPGNACFESQRWCLHSLLVLNYPKFYLKHCASSPHPSSCLF